MKSEAKAEWLDIGKHLAFALCGLVVLGLYFMWVLDTWRSRKASAPVQPDLHRQVRTAIELSGLEGQKEEIERFVRETGESMTDTHNKTMKLYRTLNGRLRTLEQEMEALHAPAKGGADTDVEEAGAGG